MSEPHFLAVVASLVDRRCLGRSRNSEFGTVDIQQVDCNIDTAMGSSDEDGKGTTLWALSDLFLVDANGQPVLDPEQADIGLSGVKIDWSRTFIRTRTYTPYNGTWRSRGPARSLISLGSVITFSEQLTEEDKKALAKGIGVHRELGYGHVWVDPPVLAESRLGAFAAPLIGAQAPPPPLKQVENKLLNWMKKRTEGRVGATAAIEKSRELADALFSANGYYDRAVAFQGRKRQLVAAPGRTQWNEVATIAGRAHGTIDLVTKLFAEQSSPCRDRQSNEPSDEFWDARYDAAANKTFRDALKAFIAEAKADSAPLVIATLAKAAAERVDRWRVGQ
ncbi:MAG: hypothetical protein HOO99_05300 [Hyphomicrobiaceae bacterium]|nr:hypothetical protein [Hyphomicrobiaceae bacterium]